MIHVVNGKYLLHSRVSLYRLHLDPKTICEAQAVVIYSDEGEGINNLFCTLLVDSDKEKKKEKNFDQILIDSCWLLIEIQAINQ